MRSVLARVTLSALVAGFVAGCSFGSSTPSQRPALSGDSTSSDPKERLASGINAYNDGNPTGAKKTLESVLELTKDQNLPDIRAAAHFYLAAVAWDFGSKKKTDGHLRQCRSVQPDYQPDWTFFAPGLRKRYEALQ